MTKAERTRQYIIEQSAPIFNTKGIAATAMSDIMQATKLAKGSLYVHFENKEELSHSAVHYNLTCLMEKITAAVRAAGTAKEKIAAYVDFLSDPLNPPVAGGCPLLNFGLETDERSALIRSKVFKVVEAIQLGIQKLVQAGIRAGEFDEKWDGRAFAVKTFALLEGGNLVSRAAGNNDQMKMIVGMIKEEIGRYSRQN